ncbi:histamine N-methyltransferase B-like isoform X2 [Anneissia japonica]|nr:histamine N-methyltransferase B-like isoform X2 [Anneissia japonica]
MATSSKIATLMSDHERYVTTFAEYSKRCRKYEVLDKWISLSFPEKIVNAIDVKEAEEFKMLGVGSGTGQVETSALKQLLTKWPMINHTVVEPNSELIAQFKDLATREGNGLHGVSFNWHNLTVEQFRHETSDQSKKYNLIMAVQILYYVDNVEEVLKYLTSLLEDGGILFVIMVAENSCFSRIAQKFPQLESEIQHAISSRHIEQMLTANQNEFKTYEIETKIDSTGCLDGDSEQGDHLIDFITQVAYLKKQASESLYNEIIEFIKSDNVSLPKTDDGRSWIRCNYDAIFVKN